MRFDCWNFEFKIKTKVKATEIFSLRFVKQIESDLFQFLTEFLHQKVNFRSEVRLPPNHMVKMCEENRGKRKEDTTAGPVGFVRAPALHTFYAKVYHIYGQKKAFYEYECLNQNVFPSISAAFRDNGFPAVDAEKALRLIIGNSPERSMQFKDPVSSIKDISPSAVAFRENLLEQDRAMVDRLMHVVFSMPDSVARNSTPINLTSRLRFAEYREESNFRKVVLFYSVGSPSVGDGMRVIIQGNMDGPNTFTFKHTKKWTANRYCRKMAWIHAPSPA
jgi:hypothetical protein